MRAKLVGRAEDWQWSSGWRRTQGDPKLTAWLSAWRVERPRDWVARVNRPQTAAELEALRVSVQRGRPFGEKSWVRHMAKYSGWNPRYGHVGDREAHEKRLSTPFLFQCATTE